jgi:preprotein translocase subunit SecF
MAFGNIYENKNYKLLVIVPIALLLISLYFIPHIPLDSTLRGGIQVQAQTNATINVQSLTDEVNAKIPGAEASVSTSPGGVSITIATNTSISNAQQELLNIYAYDSNYSSASVQVATYQNLLKSEPSNTTAQAALNAYQANETRALSLMSAQTTAMLANLKPFLTGKNFVVNSTNAQSMLNAGSASYSNATATYKTYVVSTLQGVIPFSSYTYQEITPTLGAFFLSQMETIIIASFILVAIAVFFLFRTPIPSLSVVFGAGNDIIVALGAMGLFGIPLGVASIGGLLMLIGYSIDTDMLSAIRIIKRSEGTPTERAWSTMKTGVTMTSAAIISFGILLIVSYFAFIPTYFEIASVVLFGLIADLFTTWFGNTVMVLWYKQRKDGKL